MDALKLKLRAKDQLHPLLTDLMSGYTRFKNSNEWEGRPKILHWCVLAVLCPVLHRSRALVRRASELTPGPRSARAQAHHAQPDARERGDYRGAVSTGASRGPRAHVLLVPAREQQS